MVADVLLTIGMGFIFTLSAFVYWIVGYLVFIFLFGANAIRGLFQVFLSGILTSTVLCIFFYFIGNIIRGVL